MVFWILIFIVGAVIVYLLMVLIGRRRESYRADTVDESIDLFHADIEPFLKQLEPPHDCAEAAVALQRLRTRYARMLRLANRYPKASREYQLIFGRGLKPVLDKLSYATTDRECFRDPAFKKAFDRFIRIAQKNADTASQKTPGGE